MFALRRWQFSVGGDYGCWGFTGDQHAFQNWRAGGEARYFFQPDGFLKHSIGLRAEAGQFDARLKNMGRRGQLTTAGITYHYTWKLKKDKNWYLDAGIGAGFIYSHYSKYIP